MNPPIDSWPHALRVATATRISVAIFASVALGAAATARAQEPPRSEPWAALQGAPADARLPAAAPPSAPSSSERFVHFREAAMDRFTRIAEQGRWDLYVSGYARHGRSTYTPERIEELNEQAWGGGWGKTLRGSSGHDESLFALAISDSHQHPQLMAGYVRQWNRTFGTSGVEMGLGYSAMLMSRKDILGGFPFPIALPVASIGMQRAKLMAAYVPRLSSSKGNGDVLLLLARFSFD